MYCAYYSILIIVFKLRFHPENNIYTKNSEHNLKFYIYTYEIRGIVQKQTYSPGRFPDQVANRKLDIENFVSIPPGIIRTNRKFTYSNAENSGTNGTIRFILKSTKNVKIRKKI